MMCKKQALAKFLKDDNNKPMSFSKFLEALNSPKRISQIKIPDCTQYQLIGCGKSSLHYLK